MKIAFSPCPNDTFVFHAWVQRLLPGAPKLEVQYADIDVTNHLAVRNDGPDVLKISYGALPWVHADYALLPCGGALGRGCGPLVLTSKAQDASALAGKRIAIPSERSTAYLLMRFWAERNIPGGIGEMVIMPFHEIMPAVRERRVDAGLVIHEARFTYPSYGLNLLADLGVWWETETGLPIPLGAIIARRSLDLSAIVAWIRASLHYAWAHPLSSQSYVLSHSQELSPEVVQAHIELYVNEFTANLGENASAPGYAAIQALMERAASAGIIPQIDLTKLFYCENR